MRRLSRKTEDYGAVLYLYHFENGLLSYYENNALLLYDINQSDKYIVCPPEYITKKNLDTIIIYDTDDCKICSFELPTLESCDSFFKKINDEFSLYATGCDFRLLDCNNNTIVTGQHNDWITDACIHCGFLYTISYDSCIKKWDIKTGKNAAYYPLKVGWLTSLCIGDSSLYVGTVKGDIFIIDIVEIDSSDLNQGSVWNIYWYYNKLYAVTEDGCISCYNSSLEIIKRIKCSSGWITGLTYYENNTLIAVSTYGEIVLIDEYLNSYKVINQYDFWFNNLILIESNLYIVTAEGYLLLYNLKKQVVESIRISKYQLIDICALSSKIFVIDVEGGVYSLDTSREIKCVALFPNVHFSSICINALNDQLLIASTTGVIAFLDLKNNSNRCYDFGHRIWKIDYSENYRLAVFINSAFEITVFDEYSKKTVQIIKSDNFLTTCRVVGDVIYYGDNKGDINKQQVCLNRTMKPYITNIAVTSLSDNYQSSFFKKSNNIILFYDSQDNSILQFYRYIRLLKGIQLPLLIIDLKNNKAIKDYVTRISSWPWFPQVFVNGYFLSAGSTFRHMIESGTYQRCVQNILVTEKSQHD